jgi:hypothetical protein
MTGATNLFNPGLTLGLKELSLWVVRGCRIGKLSEAASACGVSHSLTLMEIFATSSDNYRFWSRMGNHKGRKVRTDRQEHVTRLQALCVAGALKRACRP